MASTHIVSCIEDVRQLKTYQEKQTSSCWWLQYNRSYVILSEYSDYHIKWYTVTELCIYAIFGN